ncbi:Spy/CpxP family protein refolding chaperone [Legionella spiritensis]|uniref:16 kD immunogenic protein n=1 Tax=Legionella spiritensis TaxID=452 RepID=A0A0W0Z778_LEGSP|nr:Spy/CpxP family protein refolding chaperone [Legionella spiritensis]KTD64783.1 16 kD immunogenic protein [Legionella spiritensis]SNV39816.1 16 kD immunogenic protein [Legionella spiritensis]VEG90424.1 16 kD immunogenic protein [Legionella spiritensis]
MIRRLMFITMLAGSFLTIQMSYADSYKKPHHQCKAGWNKLINKLQLTDDQQTKIKAIKAKGRQMMQANREQFKAIRLKMNQLITSEKLDEAALDKLIDQKVALTRASLKSRIMTKNEIYNLLDPRQKQIFQDMMQKWEAKKKMFFKKEQD